MTSNLFTSEQLFQKNLVDPSLKIGVSNNTPSVKKAVFKKSNTVQNDTKQSEQNEKFAEMMNALKKKESAQQKKETQGETETKTAQQSADKTVSTEGTNIDVFHTQETALASLLNAIDPGEDGENGVSLDNITVLHTEIQRLIEEQTQPLNQDNTLSVTNEPKPQSLESIFALLASFLGEKEEHEEQVQDSPFIDLLHKIQDIVESDETPVILTALTPEQLTQLRDDIRKYLDGELEQADAESVEEFAAQFVSLIPPKETEKVSDKPIEISLKVVPEKTDTILPEKHHAESRYDNRYDLRYNGKSGEDGVDIKSNNPEKNNFKAVLQDVSVKSPPLQNVQNAAGFLQTSNAPSSILVADTAIPQSTTGTATHAPSPIQASLTNVITQSQSATQAHPATQMVSATIQKAVKAGEDTNIKLKLDPPELGRVEVKMSIDKDSATKIVLTAEKPETYAMLKQDAEILERALSNAGLDTDSDISFELASEDHDFNDENHGNDRKHTNNRTQSDVRDEDLIETSMDWHVNPETGRMHYNVLV